MTLPARICPSAEVQVMVPRFTLPLTRSIIPCEAPLVMIGCSLMPAFCAKNSASSCPSVPEPGET